MLDAVRQLLTDSTAITDVVGDRIFPFIREQETAMPAIMMELVEIAPLDTNSGAKTAMYEVHCKAYSLTAMEANGLMMNIRAALDRQEGTVLGYDIAHSFVDEMDMDTVENGRVFIASVSTIFHVKL